MSTMPRGMFDDKLQEVMKLLDEKEVSTAAPKEPEEAPMPSKEELLRELLEGDKDEVLTGEQAAMAEYSMMMRQWEALVEDYERRDAEEAAERAASADAEQ